MQRLRLALAVAVVSFFSVLATSPAQAYPGMSCTVSDHVVTGGDDVTVTAEVSPDIPSNWTLSYDGQDKNRFGNPVSATFHTHVVNHPTQTFVTATVTQARNSSTCVGVIILLPHDDDNGDGDGNGGSGGDNGGFLPNTGGERLAWLIIGGLLVLAGGGVIVASRRRDA